uniref:ATP synthase F0 subunit 8 n=1 Tax=Campodea lubbockii TaxID=383858 RepID=Q0ZD02_9HEXA|nr:ATP synthase F0 subunit 8 [Campodea lubbockii]ABF49578.1 ATP synthase F0 subunit 8 [Campodea lubbockii]
MPQMMPLNWLYLLIITSVSWMFMMMLIFFLFKIPSRQSSKSMDFKTFNWMW